MLNQYSVGVGILGLVILIFVSCDSKDMAEYVAKSEYAKMENSYKQIKIENKELQRNNRILNSENDILKGKLEKYTNGFKSMYE